MIVELILLGSLIGSLSSDESDGEPTNGPAISTQMPINNETDKDTDVSLSQSPALNLVPVLTSVSASLPEISQVPMEVMQGMAATPQNLDEVLKGFASDCELSIDAIENLKRMAEGKDNLFSPFVKPGKMEVSAQVKGVDKKGFAFAMDRSYLGLPLVSMYALKDDGGRLTAGLITTSSLEKAYEAFLPEMPTGVIRKLTIEGHPVQTNLVELSCSI